MYRVEFSNHGVSCQERITSAHGRMSENELAPSANQRQPIVARTFYVSTTASYSCIGALDQFGRTSAWQPAAWPHQLQWPSARCRPDVSCARSARGSSSSERPQIACQRCQRACGGRSHHPKPCQPLSRAPLDTCSLAAAPPPSHGMLRVASCRVHLSCALDHCQLPQAVVS